MRLRSCFSLAWAWAWAWVGFSGGTSGGDGRHSSLLPPGSADGRLPSEDVMRWQYDSPGTRSPASEYPGGRSDPDRVKNGRPSNGSDQLQGFQPEDTGVHPETVKQKGSNVASRHTELQPIKLFRVVGSFVLLSVFKTASTHTITWRFLAHETEQTILHYTSYSDIVSFNTYFRQRVNFNLKTGSIALKNLELEDAGLFEVTLGEPAFSNTINYKRTTFLLEVQEQLRAPHIVQSPDFVVNQAELSCIVKTGKASRLVWEKNNKRLRNGSNVRLELDSNTLIIKDMKVSDCGLYTCTVRNEVSANSNSHFLTQNGIFFILMYTLVMSVVALISNLTSFVAAGFISFIALKSSLAPNHHKEFTTIFVTLQLLSFICLLIASLLSVNDVGLSIWYRITAAFGCFLGSAMIIYVSILFLSPASEQSLSFLSNNFHRCIILACGPVSVAVSSVFIQKATEIAARCRCRYEVLIVRSVLAVLIYIFPVVLFVLFYTVYILQTFELQLKLQKVKRATERRSIL